MGRGPSVSGSDVELVLQLLSTEPLTRRELLAAWQDERETGDSAMRCAIEAARAAGHPIVWKTKRYALARSWDELNEWIVREAEPRRNRISEQISAMRARASVTWPPQAELGLTA